MSTLTWIIAVALAGGILSVTVAAALTVAVGTHRVNVLISYAIGALLGAAFLEILPHALERGDPHRMAATVLFGILAFFLLEKLVLWRHCHHDHCEAHDAQAPAHDHGRSGLLILVGDTFHNFVDGILIAAAFLESTELGIVTALAIIAHEIPQEVGDYLILLHSGYSRARALAFNLLSSLATLAGALLAYFALSRLTEWIPTLLGLGAASMIYIAVADLIPGLHKRTELKATVQQMLLIGLGVLSIVVVRALAGE
ncbi:MAG TPA: ZIP family metal transporter [Azonexus sp.]|nr:ZIP family metal transporter [Azonexus sp.]